MLLKNLDRFKVSTTDLAVTSYAGLLLPLGMGRSLGLEEELNRLGVKGEFQTIRTAAYMEMGAAGKNNLFAYPAQSNFSSVLHPLEWIERAHANGGDVLLDAAAFAPTNALDLSKYKPDFVPLSFYKIFGYPTGIGALLARREVLKKLQRPWFAGGTITVASVQGEKHYMAEAPNAFEDGTLNFLSIPAVEIGLNHLESIGMQKIHDRVHALTGWLLQEMLQVKHSNGTPVLKVYGPTSDNQRGGTIA